MSLPNRWPALISCGGAFVFACGLQMSMARQAAACSCFPCQGGFFVPQSGSIPANAPGLWWLPASDNNPADPESARLVEQHAEGDREVGITVEPQTGGGVLIRPENELVPGARYFLRGTNTCTSTNSTSEVEFTVTQPADLPFALGTLKASALTFGSIGVESGGECIDSLRAASAEITLELAEQAAPWQDLLFYETLVDGTLWRPRNDVCQEIAPGASWYGRGKDVIYLLCESSPNTLPGSEGVTAGSHTITMRAKVPGTDVVVATSALTLEFSCDTDSTASDGSSSDSTLASDSTQVSDSSGKSSSTTSDGQSSSHDTTTSLTTTSLTTTIDTNMDHPNEDGGKGCTITGQGAFSTWLISGLGLLVHGRRARRRRFRIM